RGEQGASARGAAVLVAGCAQRSSMDRTRDVPTLLRSPIHRAIMGSTDPAQTVRVGTPIPLSRQAQRGQPEGPRQWGAFLYLLSCCRTRKKVARRGEIPAGRGLNNPLVSGILTSCRHGSVTVASAHTPWRLNHSSRRFQPSSASSLR